MHDEARHGKALKGRWREIMNNMGELQPTAKEYAEIANEISQCSLRLEHVRSRISSILNALREMEVPINVPIEIIDILKKQEDNLNHFARNINEFADSIPPIGCDIPFSLK